MCQVLGSHGDGASSARQVLFALCLVALALGACRDGLTTGDGDNHREVERALLPTVTASGVYSRAPSKVPGFTAVAIQKDTLIVGDTYLDKGKSFIYQRAGSLWKRTQVVTALSQPSASDLLGSPTLNGDTLVVGSMPAPGSKGDMKGAVWIFERVNNKWKERWMLTATDPFPTPRFGISQVMANNWLVVGADYGAGLYGKTHTGAAHIYYRCGEKWVHKQKVSCEYATCGDSSYFGNALDMNGDDLIVGAIREKSNGTDSGAAHIFTRSGTLWTQQERLSAKGGWSLLSFGRSVAISGNYAAVGAANLGDSTGDVYIFKRSGSSWTQTRKLTSSQYGANYSFGSSLAMRGDVLLIGAPENNNDGDRAGAVFVWHRGPGGWKEQYRLRPTKGAGIKAFGVDLAFDGKTAAMGGDNSAFTAPIKAPTDAGAPDAGPDSGNTGPDPCAKLPLDHGPPDQALPDAELADIGITDAPPEQEGCSCNASDSRGAGLSPLFLGLLLFCLAGFRRRRLAR